MIPDVVLTRSLGTELVFRVPNGWEDRLPQLLLNLDLKCRSLGIAAFGIENSSLEEVVLSLSEDTDNDKEIPHDITAMSTGDEESCSTMNGNVVIEPSPLTFLGPTHETTPPAHQQLSWTQQVGLLYWKRFTVQKRDLKGFTFSVVVPTLVVALVLLILTVDVSLTGPAIEMSPSALGGGETDVLVGGGAAFRQRLTANRDIGLKVEKLQSLLGPLYPNTQFHHIPGMKSSSNMSHYLLETYGTYEGDMRYGSFVLNDIIDMSVAMNWWYYEPKLQRLLNNTADLFANAEIDLTTDSIRNALNSSGLDLNVFQLAIGVSLLIGFPHSGHHSF